MSTAGWCGTTVKSTFTYEICRIICEKSVSEPTITAPEMLLGNIELIESLGDLGGGFYKNSVRVVGCAYARQYVISYVIAVR